MKLQKRIYTNRESNKLIDRSFKEIGSKLEGISVNDFFNIYENLFLDIPKSGENSHNTLINRSSSYTGETNQNQINELKNPIIKLNEKISRLESENETLKTENVEKDRRLNTL